MEIVTVISILSVIGAIVVSIMTITLRTSKKADLLESASQSGDTALSQIVKNIRYAQSLNTPATCDPPVTASSITVTSLTNVQTTYSCTQGTIESNTSSLFDTSTLKVSACSFVCSQAIANDPPSITIQFTLTPLNPGKFTETNFTIPFQSTVTMRNL